MSVCSVWARKFDMQLLSQYGSTYNCLSRSSLKYTIAYCWDVRQPANNNTTTTNNNNNNKTTFRRLQLQAVVNDCFVSCVLALLGNPVGLTCFPSALSFSVQADLSLRYTRTLLGCYATNKQQQTALRPVSGPRGELWRCELAQCLDRFVATGATQLLPHYTRPQFYMRRQTVSTAGH